MADTSAPSDRPDFVRNIVIGVVTAVVVAALAFAFTRARAVLTHVDRDERVSALVDRIDELEATSNRFHAGLDTIRQRTEVLDQQQASLMTKPVWGTVSRELLSASQNENRFYPNQHGEASDLVFGEWVEIHRPHIKTVRARVSGTISNDDATVVGKLNASAAGELEITMSEGVARVRVRRLRDGEAPSTSS